MTRTARTARIAVTLPLLGALVLAVCGDGDDETTSPTAPPRATTPDGSSAATTTSTPEPDGDRDALDARRYYDEYEVSADDGASAPGGSPMTTRAGADGSYESAPLPPPGPPGPLEDNTFDPTGSNPFVATADDPLSTFGLDVDTGSWSVGEAFLAAGYRPDPDSVRVEEYVNAQEYGYAPPADADLAVHVDTGTAPFVDDGTQLVRVGVQAREVSDAERPDAVVTVVVDTSGSMDIRERLGLVQSSLAVMVNELRPTDVVAVVTYGDDSTLLLAPTPVADAETIVAAIDSLGPEGSTNLEAGVRQGYEVAREAFVPGAINTVVLASDGVANVGETGPGSLAELIRREGSEGIHLVTVGYGLGNYQDTLMEQLADQGDGFYAYVDTFEEAERLFGDDLTSTLTVVAEEARAQVAFDPAVVAGYRLLGYENRVVADEDFTDLDVDTGEVGAGHSVTVLYEVRLVDGVAADAPLGTVSLAWRSTAGGDQRQVDVALLPTPEPGTGFELAGLTAAYAEVLRASPEAVARGTTLEAVAAAAATLAASEPEARPLAEAAARAATSPQG